MLGILYEIGRGIIWVIGLGLEAHENNENKEKFRHKNGLTYTDNKGRSRLLSNNHIAMYHTYYHGEYADYVLEDIESNVIVKNFTEEQRKKEQEIALKKALDEHKTTVCLDSNNYKKHIISEKGFRGKRFKDLKTGEIYVIRKIKFRYYFMSIENGFIIRETDYSQTMPVPPNCEEIYAPIDITEFNAKQAVKMETYNWASEAMAEFYS